MTASGSRKRICACAAAARYWAPANRAKHNSGLRARTDQELIQIATDDARLLVDRDGGLEGPRGQAARVLLYLFERDAAVGLLRSG
jgi:hypothetical protein